ncbi:MAG: GAF domain-containing protein, partial [Endomicrobia bacterium]|nr:GAF domain-containing protein [Endomicrobiia bacterium]
MNLKRKHYLLLAFIFLEWIVLSLIFFLFIKKYSVFIFASIFLVSLLLIYYYFYKKTTSLAFYEKVYRIITQLAHYNEFKLLLDFAIHSISELLDAERSTIFLLNPETNMLWTLVAEELEIKEITLPVGQGIAGYVAKTGEVVKINTDVYQDKRFSALIDQKTGFRTKTVLCAPIYDKKNNIIGVIEV